MFGGLADFVKNRRALQQDTQDREFLAKNRDLALKRGTVGLRRDEFQADQDPFIANERGLRLFHDLGGPAAAQNYLTVNPSLAFSGGVTAGSMQDALKAATTQQNLTTEGMGLDVKAKGQGVQSGQIRLDALTDVSGKVNTGTFDPNNAQHTAQGALAGVPGVSTPTLKATTDAQMTVQNDQQSFVAGQNALDRSAAEARTFGAIPDGIPRDVHATVQNWLNSYQAENAAALQELQQVRKEIADNQTQIQAAAGMPNGGLKLSTAATTALKDAQFREKVILTSLTRRGNQLHQAINKKIGSEELSLPYRAILDNMMVRARAGVPERPTAQPGAANTDGAAGPIIP